MDLMYTSWWRRRLFNRKTKSASKTGSTFVPTSTAAHPGHVPTSARGKTGQPQTLTACKVCPSTATPAPSQNLGPRSSPWAGTRPAARCTLTPRPAGGARTQRTHSRRRGRGRRGRGFGGRGRGLAGRGRGLGWRGRGRAPLFALIAGSRRRGPVFVSRAQRSRAAPSAPERCRAPAAGPGRAAAARPMPGL